MSSQLLPAINSVGVFKLKEPFVNLLNEKRIYTCVAVRKLEELMAIGDFPYEKYYKPRNIDENTFNNDVMNQVCIVTLQNDSGDLFQFPSSYLLSFPIPNGIKYANLGMGVHLGALPVDTDLSLLKQEIEKLVKAYLGITPTCKSMVISTPELISHDNHMTLVKARENKIREIPHVNKDSVALSKENDTLRSKVAFLEQRLGIAEKNIP